MAATPKEIARMITDDPDILLEYLIKCPSCGAKSNSSDVFCRVCARKLPAIKQPKLTVSDFDWEAFGDDLHASMSLADISDDKPRIIKHVEIKTKEPFPPNSVGDITPELRNTLIDMVYDICQERFWEIESQTEPSGHRGDFKHIYILGNLEDADISIDDEYQTEDGRIVINLFFSVPFKTEGWIKDRLA